VLLKGVNDDPEVMKRLMQRLLMARVRPYYIYMADQVAGAEHFRTTVQAGIRVMEALRGWTSGLANPYFVIDAPGGGGKIPMSQFESAFQYLEQHTEIRDVIMSGGDPLLLNDRRLELILQRLRAIPHLEIIRIGSRVPCHLPERITPELCAMLKKYHPLYINTHFNHPDELTPAAVAGLGMLAEAGIPLGCQTVLLKGVNDSPEVMKQLMHRLLMARVRPYYIYMADQVAGGEHFRTTVQTGIKIMEALRGWTSGLAIPAFVIDAPGGGGKIPLLPEYVISMNEDEVVLRNFRGERYVYRQPQEEVGVGARTGDPEYLPTFELKKRKRTRTAKPKRMSA
jgi:L-lysine 2,3-aminomutase